MSVLLLNETIIGMGWREYVITIDKGTIMLIALKLSYSLLKSIINHRTLRYYGALILYNQ